MIDYGKYPNFKASEFACQHCGAEGIKEELVAKIQQLRTKYGKPMRITSGYRCPRHPVEARKSAPGAHALGLAADIGVEGAEAYKVLQIALELGFTGIGVQQKGSGRFIHLDIRDGQLPTPSLWSYP
jgi:zinc D-Ala-D-Ala carboxypeptidase